MCTGHSRRTVSTLIAGPSAFEMPAPNVRPVIATTPDTTDVANRENRLIRFLSLGAAPLALPVRSSTDGVAGYRSQKQWLLARSLSSTSSKVVVVPLRRSAVPLFKTNLKTAWAEGKRSAEAEIERVMPMQSAAHLAAPLMQAFGSDGPKRGKSLTQHDLVKWMLSQYEFSSKALKALAYQKIDAAIREALSSDPGLWCAVCGLAVRCRLPKR